MSNRMNCLIPYGSFTLPDSDSDSLNSHWGEGSESGSVQREHSTCNNCSQRETPPNPSRSLNLSPAMWNDFETYWYLKEIGLGIGLRAVCQFLHITVEAILLEGFSQSERKSVNTVWTHRNTHRKSVMKGKMARKTNIKHFYTFFILMINKCRNICEYRYITHAYFNRTKSDTLD